MRVDLCVFETSHSLAWGHGDIVPVTATPRGIADAMATIAAGKSDAVLFWDSALGAPHIDSDWFASRRGDVVHAGLCLGMRGLPSSVDYIQPTWMWNVDPDPLIESTSWRISLRACFIRTEVIRQLGGVRPEFETLHAAALELGNRYCRRGAIVRHDPALVDRHEATVQPLPLHDELLFARLRYGDFWARWALGRGLLDGEYRARDVPHALKSFSVPVREPATYVRTTTVAPAPRGATVSVILPTIERYPYLRQLLPQLAAQTHPVHEIIIVDQTPQQARDHDLRAEFPDLPIQIFYQDRAGQCTARNHAIRVATGEYVLFLDDDDEVKPDLVANHLSCLATYKADISCGVSEEVGAGPLGEHVLFVRGSDVFSTNNSMLRRELLRESGMFDLAYDGKQCEDLDLGVRLYLRGALAVLDPRMMVLHHHAPRGGLRVHRVRVVTRASSRTRIRDHNVPNMSEVYLARRYFSPRQVREMLFVRTWSTLRIQGGALRKAVKAAYSLASMPMTLRAMQRATAGAQDLLQTFPAIEQLAD